MAYGFYQPKFSISTTNPSGTYHISQYVPEIRIEVMNSMTWHHANYSLKFRISEQSFFFTFRVNIIWELQVLGWKLCDFLYVFFSVEFPYLLFFFQVKWLEDLSLHLSNAGQYFS